MGRFDLNRGFRLAVGISTLALVSSSCRESLESPVPSSTKGLPGIEATIRVPAGSVDALSPALTAAGPHGKVVLESGLHTESAGVVISSPVKLQGEPGAILQVETAPSLAFPAIVDIALLVREADGTEIRGIDLRPADPIGGTGIAIQRSDHVSLDGNTIRQHQFSIIVQRGDNAEIRNNTIEASTAWMTGDIPEADGMDIVNGRHVRVTGNRVSGALLGIFTSDADGVAMNNHASGCLVGMILCRIPYETFIFPDGDEVGADQTCTSWLYQGNNATDNLTAGILVIDDANHNLLVNNTGSGNGTYDLELAGDSMRFGFLTPLSHDNVVRNGNQPSLVVQDCGERNQVRGQYIDSADACEVVP
jgi:parallel beta-helix repeat protein